MLPRCGGARRQRAAGGWAAVGRQGEESPSRV